MDLDPVAKEVGRTVRDALDSWTRTARLCALLLVASAAIALLLSSR